MNKTAIVSAIAAAAGITFVTLSNDDTAPMTGKSQDSSAPVVNGSRQRFYRQGPGPLLQVPEVIELASESIIPQEFLAPPLPPGVEHFIPEPQPSIYPGSIPTDSVLDRYPGLLVWGNEHITATSSDDLRKCKLDFIARGGRLDTGYATIALRIVGNGERMEVTEVIADPSIWPANFDDEIKLCMINALLHHGAESPLEADFTVDYPLCLDQPMTR